MKNGRLPNSLVMLLPHGYEGQGPEHSSARLERFLILCAQDNMQVCNLSTPAQYFHVLRRQMTNAVRKPLVIMTPKSLLRHPEAKSAKEEFISGSFREVIDDDVPDRNKIKKILITSGKLYYDLTKYRTETKIENAAIIRLEQFYPFPYESMREIIRSYPNAEKITWVQEEPKNMGAWAFLSNRIQENLELTHKLEYAGRPEGASPAVGSYKVSMQQQKDLVIQAFS